MIVAFILGVDNLTVYFSLMLGSSFLVTFVPIQRIVDHVPAPTKDDPAKTKDVVTHTLYDKFIDFLFLSFVMFYALAMAWNILSVSSINAPDMPIIVFSASCFISGISIATGLPF